MNAYTKLKNKFSDIANIEDITSILSWDQATMMPSSAAEQRGNQLGLLNRIHHQMFTHPDFEKLLHEASNESLNSQEASNLKEMKRSWLHTTSVPEDLSSDLAKATTVGQASWENALHHNSFAEFSPHLENILKLSLEAAKYKAEKLNCSPYDACIDSFDSGARVADIDPIFTDLEDFIPSFLSKVINKQSQKTCPKLNRKFDVSKQKELGLSLIKAIGFDFSKGRVDVSTHPFCGGTPYDVRVTSRFDENNFTSGLMAMVHEAGHALYEFGLPLDWHGQPAGMARGMSFHESQSLLIEMQMCRSQAFIEFLYPKLISIFDLPKDEWSLENVQNLYYQVKPGFIRVDADEVTYPMHVMLRYNIEKQLFSGDLTVSDIPTFWNSEMERLLGLSPKTDKEGCLQDIHWACGGFGYFPSYTIGALTAAQIYQSVQKSIPQLDEEIRNGQFSSLLSWLRQNIHQKASFSTKDDILIQATGEKLSTKFYKDHVEKRYLS